MLHGTQKLGRIAVLCASFVLCATAALAQTDGPATVDIVRVGRGPRIDGKLDDAVWANAARLVDFHLLGRDRAPSSKTEGSLLTDGQWLYIGVRCEEAAPEELHNKIKRRDDAVNADDSIEIFIDPGTRGVKYFHFILNVGNVQADQLVVRGQRRRNWYEEWQSATYIDPDVMASKGWSHVRQPRALQHGVQLAAGLEAGRGQAVQTGHRVAALPRLLYLPRSGLDARSPTRVEPVHHQPRRRVRHLGRRGATGRRD